MILKFDNLLKSHLKYYFILAMPLLAIFFIIPLELYYNGREYWNWNRLVPVSFAATGAVLYLAAVVAARSFFRINEKVTASFVIILFWLGAFILLADVFAPLQSTPLDGSELKSTEPLKYTLIEVMIFIVLLVVALKRRHSVVPIAAIITIPIVVMSIIYLVFVFSATKPSMEDKDTAYSKSEEAVTEMNVSPDIQGNVYHILLDEMQTDMARLYIKENGLEKHFSGFTMFENNVSNYIYTNASLPSYMSGTLYSEGPFIEWAKEDFKHTGILEAMHKRGYQGVIFAGACPSYFYCMQQSVYYKQYTGIMNAEFMDFTQIWFARLLPNVLSNEALRVGKHLGQLVFRIINGQQQNIPVAQDEGLDSFTSALAFRQIIDTEKDMPPTGRYMYFHAMLPHFPFFMDENCNYSPDMGNRSVNGYYQQAGCALHLVVDFIDELKRLGRYDSSTIVVHGDTGHGHLGFVKKKGSSLVSTANPKNRNIAFMPQFIYWSEEQLRARVHSLLMIKPANQDGNLSYSARPSQLIDIYPTLIDLLSLPHDGSIIAGLPLFGENFPERREASFYIYGVNDLAPDEIMKIDIADQRELAHTSLTVAGYVKELPMSDFPADGVVFDIGAENEGRLQCRRGFSSKETTADKNRHFRWATGHDSRIVLRGFRLPQKMNSLLVTFQVFPFQINKNKKMIVRSRLSTKEVTLHPGWSKYGVVLDFPGGEDLSIDILYEDAASPVSLGVGNDTRELSIAWDKVSFSYIEPLTSDKKMSFGKNGNSKPYEAGGWSTPEERHTWTSGKAATLNIPILPPKTKSITLRAELHPFIVPGKVDGQAVRVLVNGRKAGTWNITKQGFQEQTLKIPASLLTDPYSLKLTFELPDAVSPAAVGYNQDRRVLGLAFRSLRLSDE